MERAEDTKNHNTASHQEVGEEHDHRVTELDHLNFHSTTQKITLNSFPEINQKLSKNLETLIPLFLHLKRMSPEGIWHIYLRNYIEEIALWAVGIENVAQYIALCLARG
jgi:hypothetical protein